MIGGDKDAAVHLDPIFATLAPGIGDIPRTPVRTGAVGSAEQGYLYCGPAGAGHFVKMIHNGIEYGMMQAFAEGFEILKGAAGSRVPEERRYELPLADIAEVWRRGSVVSSWLLDLLAESLVEDPTLGRFSGKVDDSGEGRWTVQTAIEEGVPATVLTAALYTRFRSRADKSFAEQTLSALRAKFGGHREAG
jgi:6-phosphogluconate dehydrogenase